MENLRLNARFLYLVLILLSTGFSGKLWAQNGPGGIGDGNGDNGPRNVVWLDASLLGLSNDDPVLSWPDQSGNGNNLSQQGSDAVPIFRNDGLDGTHAVARFDATERYLSIADNTTLDGGAGLSVIIVMRSALLDGAPRALLSKRTSFGAGQSYSLFTHTSNLLNFDVFTSSNSRINSSATALNTSTDYILSSIYNGSTQDINVQSAQANSGSLSGSVADAVSPLILGALNDNYGTYYSGDIAEVIIYNEGITDAERIVVENYLSNKYGINIGANDFWSDNATYSNQIAGIGQESSTSSEAVTAASGYLRISESTDLSNGDWLFWGHDNADASVYTSTETITGSALRRVAREWLVEETGSTGTVTVSVAESDFPSTGITGPRIFLLTDADGIFTDATATEMTLSGGAYSASVDLSDNSYLTIAYEAPLPAGLSNSLAFWYQTDIGVQNGGSTASSGENVTLWSDLSASANDAQNGTAPVYLETSSVNYHPVIQFDRASSEFLELDISALENSNYTIAAVIKRQASTSNLSILGSESNTGDAFALGYSTNTLIGARNSATTTVSTGITAFDSPAPSPAIVTLHYDGSNLSITEYRDANSNSQSTATSNNYNPALSQTGNLGASLGGNYFDGEMLEIVGFDASLNTNEQNALVSQLAIKYGISLNSSYIDEQNITLWNPADNAGYTSDVAAIAFDSSFELDQRITKAVSDSLILSTSTDFTSLNSATARTTLSEGQYVFASSDGGTFAAGSSYNGVANSRMNRVWRIRELNSPGAIFTAIPQSLGSYDFALVSSDPTFATGVSQISLTSAGGFYYLNYDFTDGDYITFLSDASEIWYSYLSGNWTDPANWTLDGAVAALYINPSSKIPSLGDSVVIRSGRTITANVDGIDIEKLELIGILDLANTSGHDFTQLEGNGTLRAAGDVGGIDNYPSGEDSLFYDVQEGGTVEYYGSGLTLSEKRQYNQLVINMDADANFTTVTADSITVYGNLQVSRGVLQFNDNSSTGAVVLAVEGNLLVSSNGGIETGTANARHELNLSGDFTNQGIVNFTNRSSANTSAEATDGIVDVNFISATSDQVVQLENTTDFYRIEINKGVDDTYTLDLSATDPSYFNLYGYAGLSTNSAQETSNDNAFGLIYGTAKIGNNIDIPVLNNTGNYSIYEGSQVWVAGGSIAKTAGTAIVPYGKMRITSGLISAPINSGITTRNNGQLTIEGGTVTVNQFRTSVLGVSAQGGLIMTGGIFNITGGSTNTNYYTFSLTYTGNVFSMTGGTINLSGSNSRGGIYINSSAENVVVTGGTINLDVTNNNNLSITSTAPFYDLNILQSASGSGSVILASGNSGDGAGNTSIDLQNFAVLNDLTIDNSGGFGTSFNTNGVDLNITGSLEIQNGAVADFTGMELTFDELGTSFINIQTGATFTVDTLIINKTNPESNVDIIDGAADAVTVNNLLSVASGNLDGGAFNIAVLGDLSVADTIGSDASTGRVRMLGAASQTITSTAGLIYDLEINNANGVVLDGDLSVWDDLMLELGIFDINTDGLTVTKAISTTGTYGSSLMVQTSGNSSDDGISVYFDGATADPAAVLYPLGTNANSNVRYTPALLDLSDIDNDGYVQINTSDTELQTVDVSALSSNMLSYYWRIRHQNFGNNPTVQSVTFIADDSDDPDAGATPAALPTGFVPGKVLDGTPFTRSQENTTDISGLSITFDGSGSGFEIEDANYTAGDGSGSLFSGTPTVYYSTNTSRQNWDNESKWSLTDDGVDDGNTGFPGVGDIAVIKSYNNRNQNHWVNINTDIEIAELIFDNSEGGWRPRAWATRRNAVLNLGPVSGVGEIFLEVTASEIASFVGNTDLGLFSDAANSIFVYKVDSDNQLVDMISNITTYPNLRIEAGDGADDDDNRILQTSVPIRVNNNIFMDRSPRFRVNHDLSVGGDVRVTWQANRTTFEIGDDRQVTIDIEDDLRLENGNGDDASRIVVKNDNMQGFEHIIRVADDVVIEDNLAATSTLDLYNGTGLNNNAILELNGSLAGSFTNSSSATLTPDLYRVVINKGSDTTSAFTFNDEFTLNGDTRSVPQAFELQNGKAIFDDPEINVELADSAQYTIPASAGLEVTQGTVTSNNTTLILDGLLKVNGGTVDLDSTAIEYSNTGSALLQLVSGSLDVGYQVRRATTSSSGILKYRQTGGTVSIATDGAPVPERGVFEVLNNGSEFTFTAGTFNLTRGVSGDNNPSLLLDPTTVDLTGSTINLYTGLASDYGANFFNIQSAAGLNNLVLNNTIDLPDVRIYVQPLTVNDLTINSNQAFVSDGLDLSLTGNLTNAGSYTSSNASTRFAGTGSQSLSGAGSFSLFNLVQEGSSTTSIGLDLSLGNDLFVSNGTLSLGNQQISLQNDAFIESTVSNTSGNGIVFDGSAGQDLYGLANSTVSVGTITINNANGIDIPDGNGFDFDITRELRLAAGVFDIGNALISIKSGGTITAVNPFGVTNMVQTNSSFTDNGLLIEFPTVSVDTMVFFPVGELTYTPVSFDLSSGTTAGSIRVRPANEQHPTIVNDVEPVTESQIDDTQNILTYYWVVEAAATTNVLGTATFFYDHNNIVATESDTSNFISGRLLSNNITWDKFPPTLFNGGSQTFTVPLDQGSGVTFNEITGDYTAGYGSTDGINNDIEGSIPNSLAVYESNVSGASGNYSTDGNWTAVGSPALSSGIGPVGAIIRVMAGDTVDLDISNIRLYSTEIAAGGVLRVNSGSINNRLGNVTGTGTIVLTDNELLPVGAYSEFLSCDGGALQYSGTSSYSVLSGITQVRKVIFDGSGTRTLPNNALTVCDTMIINGPQVALSSGLNYTIGDSDDDRLEIQNGSVSLSNGSTMDVNGDFIMSGGSFTGAAGTNINLSDDLNYSGGTLDWNSTSITLDGSSSQQIDGDFTGSRAMQDLTINNTSSGGVDISSGGIEVDGTLTFTDGLVNPNGGTLAITSNGDWEGASSASYVTGPLTKQNVPVASSFNFPIGKAARYAQAWVVNVGTGGQDWTAEYFTSTGIYDESTFDASDPGSGLNPLQDVSSRDRWEITSSGSNSAEIRLWYGSHLTIPDQDNLRVVWWDPTDSRWENRGGLIDGSASEGTVTSENMINFSTQQFSIGQASETTLPVELIFFQAALNDGITSLTWATASELNNDFFEVQRSANGFDFEVIGVVKGAGTTTSLSNYDYTDRRPLIGTVYYRLKQVDFDGQSAYSDVALVDNSDASISFETGIYPNPTRDHRFTIQLRSGDEVSPVLVEVYDTNGRVYHQQQYQPTDFYNDLQIATQTQMPAGIYIVIVKQNNNRSSMRLLVR